MGTDAHAKNYSFLIASGGQVRLAPLYDLASALPYPQDIPYRKARLAMKIGSHYNVKQIELREWDKTARELRLDAARLRARIIELAKALPDAANATAERLRTEGIEHDVVARLVPALVERSHVCISAIEMPKDSSNAT